MKFSNRTLLSTLFVLAAVVSSSSQAQAPAQKSAPTANTATTSDAEKKNIQAYINLMRENVRQDKAEIMGAIMVLSAADAAKFWPIYSEYDAQLTKLNDQRVENIKQYVHDYAQMTDEEADQLVQKSMSYQKERAELLAQTYEKVKQAVGAINAARFALVEHQLLLIIDLQIASSLPVVGQGS
jgi:hypothetical protein